MPTPRELPIIVEETNVVKDLVILIDNKLTYSEPIYEIFKSSLITLDFVIYDKI